MLFIQNLVVAYSGRIENYIIVNRQTIHRIGLNDGLFFILIQYFYSLKVGISFVYIVNADKRAHFAKHKCILAFRPKQYISGSKFISFKINLTGLLVLFINRTFNKLGRYGTVFQIGLS